MSRYYIGLSTSGHDPSFAIVDSLGDVLFAEATERYLQDKRAYGCLPDHKAHIESFLSELIRKDPKAEFKVSCSWKNVKADLDVEISDALMPANIGEWLRSLQAMVRSNAGVNIKMLGKERVLKDLSSFDHHLCHAAAAVFSAPFDHAACLVLDGEGEVGSASLFEWKNGALKRVWRSWGPGSLGTFYSTLTELCGFDSVKGEEWKVMGLAAYGEPREELLNLLRQLITIENGKPVLGFQNDLASVMRQLHAHSRSKNDPVMNAADLAASGQIVYSELANKIIEKILPRYSRLILTGGCALNSSFNGTILKNYAFEAVHVPCAPADDGNSLGAALLAWQEEHPHESLPFHHTSPFLGSGVDLQQLENVTKHTPLSVKRLDDDATDFIAEKLAAGKIIGIMRGRAEFGPRALGNRSILADPRAADMKQRMNEIVKGREGYRPFAPVIPAEETEKWFETSQACPYMSYTLPWRDDVKHLVPAVVHYDGTGRLQTVDETNYPWLHRLTRSFEKITGIPVLLNTSFNIMGKPIIHSVNDAISILHMTGLNAVLIENVYIEKEAI